MSIHLPLNKRLPRLVHKAVRDGLRNIKKEKLVQHYCRFVGVLAIVLLFWGLPQAKAQIPPASTNLCLFVPKLCPLDGTNPSGPGTDTDPVSNGKIIINADAWIGNKSVTAGDTLKIGKNTLVITKLTAKTGNDFGISGYEVPSAGKAVWDQLTTFMGERVIRGWVSGRGISLAAHCGGDQDHYSGDESYFKEQPIRELNFDGKHDPFTGASLANYGTFPNSRPIAFWQKAAASWSNQLFSLLPGVSITANNPCPIVLAPNVRIHGTGTIVNIDNLNDIQPILVGKTSPTVFVGGGLEIQGRMLFDNPNDTLGYISFAHSKDPESGKVTIDGNAEVRNMAIFTTGTIEIKENPNADFTNNHKANLISRILSFPPRTTGTIIFDRSEALENNPPPLFENFDIPGAKEKP